MSNTRTHTPVQANAEFVKMVDPDGREVGLLEALSGKVYSMDGKYERTLVQEGVGYHSDNEILHQANLRDAVDFDRAMALEAASYDCRMKGAALHRKLQLRDAKAHSVLMDLGPADVHIQSAMPNIAMGYSLDEGVADIASPVVPSSKKSDKYWQWAAGNTFAPAAVTMGAGGPNGVNEISPALSNNPFNCVDYALACCIPTDVEMNADAPLVPYQAGVDMVMDKLRLAREFRAITSLTNTGGTGWNSNNVLALTSGQQWNGGASSDPVANIQFIQDRTAKKITRILMAGSIFRALQRNASVRQYHFAKPAAPALPNAQELSRILELPPIVVAEMKYQNASGAMTYVWPGVAGASTSPVVLIHEPAQNPPSNGRETASAYTFRWTGAPAPDGTVTGGFMVRSYYDQRRGPRGSRVVVVVHSDAEVLTGPIVGGLISGTLQ